MRRLLLVAIAALAMLASRESRATPSARLVYSRAPGAQACADEEGLRRAVAARVGYDPFFGWAPKTVVVSVAPSPRHGFVARIHLVDERGVEHGARELRAGDDCAELLPAAALAIAIAIDPQSLLAPAPGAPPPEPERAIQPAPASTSPFPSAVAPPREAPPPAAGSRASGPAIEGIAGGVVSVGVAPKPAVGASLGVALRWARLSLGLEGRLDAPASERVAPAASSATSSSVSSFLAVATLAPCLRVARLLGCALAQAGAMNGTADGPGGRSSWTPWLAAGGRVAVLVPMEAFAALRIRADILANLYPPRLELNGRPGQPGWDARAVAASFGAEAVFRF